MNREKGRERKGERQTERERQTDRQRETETDEGLNIDVLPPRSKRNKT